MPELCTSTLRDIEGLDEGECGFNRELEDGGKPCRGDLNGGKRLDGHLFIVTATAAPKWPKKVEEAAATDFPEAQQLKDLAAAAKSKGSFKVSLVTIFEWSAGSGPRPSPGQVLCFAPGDGPSAAPRNLLLPAGVSADYAVAAACGAAPPGALLQPASLGGRRCCFVCAHTKRDGRCGLCGPVLADTVAAHLRSALDDGHAGRTATPFCVAKVSHVGGHAYAGNMLVYDSAGLDWFGYVKPAAVAGLLGRRWDDATFATWRGRVGVKRDDLAALQRAIEEVAGAGPAWRKQLSAPRRAPVPTRAPAGGGGGGGGGGGDGGAPLGSLLIAGGAAAAALALFRQREPAAKSAAVASKL